MAKHFHLKILTPEKTVFNGDILSLTAPGEVGYLGILADHAALATTLIPGTIVVKETNGERKSFDLKGHGFLEILKNQATILVDHL